LCCSCDSASRYFRIYFLYFLSFGPATVEVTALNFDSPTIIFIVTLNALFEQMCDEGDDDDGGDG